MVFLQAIWKSFVNEMTQYQSIYFALIETSKVRQCESIVSRTMATRDIMLGEHACRKLRAALFL